MAVRQSVKYYIYLSHLIFMSSLWIEHNTAINQFFYRESPLPIGSPTLNICNIYNIIKILNIFI